MGSFLRPERLKRARQEFASGKLSKEALREVENEEISKLVDKQFEVGLKAVTDGEFRRSFWHLDFLEQLNGIEGYIPEHGYFFEGVETRKYDVRTSGKVSFNPEHPFLEDFRFLKETVGKRGIPKFTIPSLNQLLHDGIRDESIYPTIEGFAHDIRAAYRDAIKAFYDAGCRYLQIDDCYWGALCSNNFKQLIGEERWRKEKQIALENIQAILTDIPEDLVITTHVCRGNYASAYAGEGAYDPVAEELFGQTNFDGYFLEYDTERAGGFEPLNYFKGNGQIVLGLITSKFGELEDEQAIKDRIHEAAKFVPLDQLSISPQCGFASTEEGNVLTEEEQWNKLAFVLKIAEDVWSAENKTEGKSR